MANNITIDAMTGDTGLVIGDIHEISGALGGLEKTVKNLTSAVAGAFVLGKAAAYLKEAAVSSGKLDKQLLVLRLSLGKMKAAIGDAAAPIAAVFLPLIQKAVWGVTRFVRAAGQVIGALLGGSKASNALADSTLAASNAQKKLVSTGEKVKRTLAGFDEITRMNGAAGGCTDEAVLLLPEEAEDTLSPKLQGIVDRIRSLLEPLRQIDFSGALEAFGKLRQAVSSLGSEAFAGLNWAWHNLLVPLAAWTIEDLLPVFLEVFSNALLVLDDVITALKPAAGWLWENFLKPVAEWTGQAILQALTWLAEKLQVLGQWIGQNQPLVQKLAMAVAAVAGAVVLANTAFGNWNLLGGLATDVMGRFGGALKLLGSPISLLTAGIGAVSAAVALLIANWDKVKTTAISVWESVRAVWGSVAGWFRQNLLTPLSNGFRSTVNGIIGFLNALISGIVSGINALVGAVNKLSFQIPSWVPGVGGNQLGFSLRTISAPTIPYLAQGAVLPANRPFMAVVGDQRHGTNVEAPLTTIQEAVALVMEDMITSNLAGHERIVMTLGQILEAVLGIEIGDTVIGQAAERYHRKMAVVRGGFA